MNNIQPNTREQYWNIDYSEMKEILPNAVYVAETCLKTEDGWSPYPAGVFYQDLDDGSRSFAAFFKRGFSEELCITQLDDFDTCVGALLNTETGELLWSRYTHDIDVSLDGTARIGGGREFPRWSHNDTHDGGDWKLVTWDMVSNQTY